MPAALLRGSTGGLKNNETSETDEIRRSGARIAPTQAAARILAFKNFQNEVPLRRGYGLIDLNHLHAQSAR